MQGGGHNKANQRVAGASGGSAVPGFEVWHLGGAGNGEPRIQPLQGPP